MNSKFKNTRKTPSIHGQFPGTRKMLTFTKLGNHCFKNKKHVASKYLIFYDADWSLLLDSQDTL